jgi:beta-N-acetylhexosaminidase
MARELRAAGFDSGLTPVLDCLTDPVSAAIGDRAYGADPERVTACGLAFIEAAGAEGLLTVVKHFPGHGRTPLDSHVVLPEVDATIPDLEATELRPFRRALQAGCPAVMVSHVRYRSLDPEWPASLSRRVISDLLRGDLGFDGLVLSDDLEMRAVAEGWGTAKAAARFLEAGGDLALVCRDRTARAEARDAVTTAIEAGRVDLRDARARRAGLRERLERAGPPRPTLEVIGCAEHRELAEEVLRRGA